MLCASGWVLPFAVSSRAVSHCSLRLSLYGQLFFELGGSEVCRGKDRSSENEVSDLADKLSLFVSITREVILVRHHPFNGSYGSRD